MSVAYPETSGRRQFLIASLDGTVLQQVGHGYDENGRLEALTSLDHQAIYGYHPASSLKLSTTAKARWLVDQVRAWGLCRAGMRG